MTISGLPATAAGGDGPASAPGPAGSPENEVAEAERVLAALLPPIDPAKVPVLMVIRLVLASGLTVAGAGVVLGGPVLRWLCLALVAAWSCLIGVQLRKAAGRAGEVARAAAVHAAALPGRVPAGTLAAASRQLGAAAAARRGGQAWLYVAPCPGPDKPCTVFCATASTKPLGRNVLLILGEHPAALPDVAASALAHEAGHHVFRWLWQVHYARITLGWGWAAAGLAGAAAGGWAGVAIAAGLFWVVSLAALWAGETGCDLRAVRTEGHPAAEAGFGYLAGVLAGRPVRPRASPPVPSRSRTVLKAVLTALDWAGGPAHPPLRLRRSLVRALTRTDNRVAPDHGSASR